MEKMKKMKDILKKADEGVISALGTDRKKEMHAEEIEVRVGGKVVYKKKADKGMVYSVSVKEED